MPLADRRNAQDSKRAPKNRSPLEGLHFLVVAGLLVLPALAIYRGLGTVPLQYVGGWVLVISVVTWVVYAVDKRRARNQDWREPESHLHLLELLGGWPGAFLAQRWLRHKSAKKSYQVVFFLIIGLHQFLAIDALRGWALFHLLLQSVHKL